MGWVPGRALAAFEGGKVRAWCVVESVLVPWLVVQVAGGET